MFLDSIFGSQNVFGENRESHQKYQLLHHPRKIETKIFTRMGGGASVMELLLKEIRDT